jgi:hypothetical protein
MYELLITNISIKEVKEISKIISISPTEILKAVKEKRFVLAFCEYPDSEKLSFSKNQLNAFNLFYNLVKMIEKSTINFYIKDFENIDEAKKDYLFYKKTKNATDVLSDLHEAFPTSISWEQDENEEQKFYVEIDGQVYDSEYALEYLIK